MKEPVSWHPPSQAQSPGGSFNRGRQVCRECFHLRPSVEEDEDGSEEKGKLNKKREV